MGARRQGMKVDCSASHHVALPTPADLLKAWAEPRVMNTHRALDQKSSIRALERKLSQLRLSQHGRQRRDSPPDRCPKPERYEQDQGQGRSRVRPIIRLLLVQRLGPQPQRTGATSKFVHQVPSIWCAPHSLTQFLCRNVSSSCVIKVSLATSRNLTAARKAALSPASRRTVTNLILRGVLRKKSRL